ncbi:hypothetical protein L1987_11547 [Smallanthus sonchifolius]|uniref:Uncharacterized protein n=1 Tax=Smallanthus sonchifolius TaxID=185202 RepID=A0ACB9JBC1_9ASTR|nr:hypothetical protein L1987_11547 [Smallanthus sonchifolius]
MLLTLERERLGCYKSINHSRAYAKIPLPQSTSMASPSQASLLLQKQLKDLCKNPVDGFSAGLVDESNLFEWSVTVIGPPDTLYEGGFFNAIMSFLPNYPNSPPTFILMARSVFQFFTPLVMILMAMNLLASAGCQFTR